MPRIRDYAYNRSNSREQSTGQALKVTMFEEEIVAENKESKAGEEEVFTPLASDKSENAKIPPLSLVERVDEKADENSALSESGVTDLRPETNSVIVATQAVKTNTSSSKGDSMVEKIVSNDADLNPKYTDADAAVKSITQYGQYYEDYGKGAANGLTQNKEFVLSIIAQNADRFYSPLTPTPSDWLDEEFITSELKYTLDRLKEGEDATAVEAIGSTLYEFLHRAAFGAEAYEKIATLSRLVAKVASACVVNAQDGERTKSAVNRFFEAVKTAKAFAKTRHEKSAADAKERAEKLDSVKKGLFDYIVNEKI